MGSRWRDVHCTESPGINIVDHHHCHCDDCGGDGDDCDSDAGDNDEFATITMPMIYR